MNIHLLHQKLTHASLGWIVVALCTPYVNIVPTTNIDTSSNTITAYPTTLQYNDEEPFVRSRKGKKFIITNYKKKNNESQNDNQRYALYIVGGVVVMVWIVAKNGQQVPPYDPSNDDIPGLGGSTGVVNPALGDTDVGVPGIVPPPVSGIPAVMGNGIPAVTTTKQHQVYFENPNVLINTTTDIDYVVYAPNPQARLLSSEKKPYLSDHEARITLLQRISKSIQDERKKVLPDGTVKDITDHLCPVCIDYKPEKGALMFVCQQGLKSDTPHRVCVACLKQMISQPSYSNRNRCPLCREKFGHLKNIITIT